MKTTRFVLRLPQLRIELAGEKTFVEELYRTINRDFTPLIEAARRGELGAGKLPEVTQENPAVRSGHTWVYLCTAYFNKVYVMENSRLEAGLLGRFLDIDRLRRIYVAEEHSPVLAGLSDTDQTLFAEFTEEGRAALRKMRQGQH